MERKTESVKKLSCLPCQSLQTLSLSFDHPRLFLSFFALRDETDTHTHKPTNDKHTTLELWAIIWEERKRS